MTACSCTSAPRKNGGTTSAIQIGTAASIIKAPAPAKNLKTRNMAIFTLPARIAPETIIRIADCQSSAEIVE